MLIKTFSDCLRKGGYELEIGRSYTCYFVGRLAQKFTGVFGRNFQRRLDLAQLESDSFLWWSKSAFKPG